jgi:NTE family protein
MFARMVSVFSMIFDQAQNASIHRLHEAQRTGQIKRFIFPYLGQLDRQLPNPPANLVRREEAHAYPTDFNAMSGEWIERLSLRGEQLTLCLARTYIPGLIRDCSLNLARHVIRHGRGLLDERPTRPHR